MDGRQYLRVSSVEYDAQPIGTAAPRPDGMEKVEGRFHFVSDLSVPEMLHGGTLRSPYARAAIRSIDLSGAVGLPGVHAVLTQGDVKGAPCVGAMEVDQPVLADGQVRYHGEPVALVAADTPATVRFALSRIRVDYLPDPAVTDACEALADKIRILDGRSNIVRRVRIRRGAMPDTAYDVVVKRTYWTGRQDPAFLDPEVAVAVPGPWGGIDIHVGTQWSHSDHRQIAASLALEADRVRVLPGGMGGAFGGREDLSVQLHAAMLALSCGKPVRLRAGGSESMHAHAHRHPAEMQYEHRITGDGRLTHVKARILLDSGPYASSSGAVAAAMACCAVGPYEVENVDIEVVAVRTSNPPSGAMRGFGAVQPAVAYESQMDELAARLGWDPVEIRRRNAMSQGSILPTGQVLRQPAPVQEMLDRLEQIPRPTTAVRPYTVRGTGIAVGIKNVGFIEGFDDYATALVRVQRGQDGPHAVVITAAAEVGQGLTTVLPQIVRTELDVRHVTVEQASSAFDSAGPTSSSRQTYMTGGAVRAACLRIRAVVLARAGGTDKETPYTIGRLNEVLDAGPIEEEVVFRHRPTAPLSESDGQGDAAYQYAFAAQRAVVDVDRELGTVHMVEMATVQDVGRALNPRAVRGQIHGGAAQGIGFALTEHLQVQEGMVGNPTLAGYLIPTALDVPTQRVELLEEPDPDAPYGLRGVGEPPIVSAPAAVAAAVRDAVGHPVTAIPIDPRSIAMDTSEEWT